MDSTVHNTQNKSKKKNRFLHLCAQELKNSRHFLFHPSSLLLFTIRNSFTEWFYLFGSLVCQRPRQQLAYNRVQRVTTLNFMCSHTETKRGTMTFGHILPTPRIALKSNHKPQSLKNIPCNTFHLLFNREILACYHFLLTLAKLKCSIFSAWLCLVI